MNKLQWFSLLLLPVALTIAVGCSSGDAPSESSAAPASAAQQPPASGLSADQQIQVLDDAPPAPDTTLETMDGETIALADRPGEVLLVNFWATWCAPCRKEIPDLIDLQNELGPRGLTVIGVSFDQQGAEIVKPFLNEYSVNYPIVLDPGSTLDRTFGGIYGLPMTFVIGPEGRMHYKILGAFPTDKMRPKLTALLDAASEGTES